MTAHFMLMFWLAGPQQAVKDFVLQLKSEDIFAREVNSSGVAFHSYFMESTGVALKEALNKVGMILFANMYEMLFGGAYIYVYIAVL